MTGAETQEASEVREYIESQTPQSCLDVFAGAENDGIQISLDNFLDL